MKLKDKTAIPPGWQNLLAAGRQRTPANSNDEGVTAGTAAPVTVSEDDLNFLAEVEAPHLSSGVQQDPEDYDYDPFADEPSAPAFSTTPVVADIPATQYHSAGAANSPMTMRSMTGSSSSSTANFANLTEANTNEQGS